MMPYSSAGAGINQTIKQPTHHEKTNRNENKNQEYQ